MRTVPPGFTWLKWASIACRVPVWSKCSTKPALKTASARGSIREFQDAFLP
ncbi:MAG: hypothetical protein QM757_41605 [Paludibaculum sp.]